MSWPPPTDRTPLDAFLGHTIGFVIREGLSSGFWRCADGPRRHVHYLDIAVRLSDDPIDGEIHTSVERLEATNLVVRKRMHPHLNILAVDAREGRTARITVAKVTS